MFKNKQKWQYKLANFLRGRYATNDKLNQHLMIFALVLIGISLFTRIPFLQIVSILILGVSYFRLFSKNSYKRSRENRKYISFITKIKRSFALIIKKVKTRKVYKYFRCPECRQSIRAPRNKGKIVVTCSNCHKKFQKKT